MSGSESADSSSEDRKNREMEEAPTTPSKEGFVFDPLKPFRFSHAANKTEKVFIHYSI